MPDRDRCDEIPVADAVEQNQDTAPQPAAVDPADAPMEANPPDWQEQLQEVPEDDEEYRE
ncbi:hypothetical protein BMW24_013485 [Mycobacterium heckeshornense]|uniref:Uncharacterized protein n=1 Tax=Mycobacterium heckeshornense TaxID=110505 RepID=A0A2G8B871_9MYCO|nr:hypothetical protein [Mycobacterium heckeshornense]KMV22172.1 hypothetical protein ACT16_12910 [Mycobacterium heckeshornense]MCV7033227.1 hypothetical protein [Mycobacterium heckeshornense]PIJ33985.1 hypothetical protein BMW24_013485 [Mycobacterium heckeshornense]BCO37364.1 hypothetical protein MHEC_37970 [Mycobacterium heckeshornense]BCQ10241.1 hypothetical protein JMUB5695_03696 [Mycobacterium heckeshornense]